MQDDWSSYACPCYITKGEFIASDGTTIPFKRIDRHLCDAAVYLMHKNSVKYTCSFFPYGWSIPEAEVASRRLAAQIKSELESEVYMEKLKQKHREEVARMKPYV